MNEQKNPEQKKQASHFMAFYVVALFSIALVLILLSYLTQVRADDQVAHAETQLQEQVSATQGVQAKMEILQETSNEQVQRIAELEQSLSEEAEKTAQLEACTEAQSQLIQICGYALRGEEEQKQAGMEALIQAHTLEALDGTVPEKLIWSQADAEIFNRLREGDTENSETEGS